MPFGSASSRVRLMKKQAFLGRGYMCVELLAWVEVLEGVKDWSRYAAAFPMAPGEGEATGWAMGLAKSLAGVRTSL